MIYFIRGEGMKKLLKIFVLITSVFLITGCGGNSVKEISYSDFDK